MLMSGYGDGLTKRFSDAVFASMIAKTHRGQNQIAFSRLKAEPYFRLQDITQENAYTVHVNCNAHAILRVLGKKNAGLLHELGRNGVSIYDLTDLPNLSMDTDFDTVRIYMPHDTIAEMADAMGLRGEVRLQQPGFGFRDPVLADFAGIIDQCFRNPERTPQLMIDHLALAVQSHLLQNYAVAAGIRRTERGGLALWQERRAKDLISANLNTHLSVEALAAECGLSASHFASAFRKSTGMAPHQYLMERRIEAASLLIRGSSRPLSDIASECGF